MCCGGGTFYQRWMDSRTFQKPTLADLYMCFLDYFVQRSLGKALCFLFYGLLLVVIASEYLIILPYENCMRPSFLIPIYYVTGLYLIINILYHYWKVCTVDPGKPESSDLWPRCHRCENYKPKRAHHCAICNRCVLFMDHHCIWINQCVGLYNHRYFLQFILFVWFSQLLILFSNYNTFFEHLSTIHNPQMVPFCVQPIEMVPWRKWMCENMADFVNGCVCFDYGLAILLVLVLGGLAAFNIYMISIGETLIDYLQDADERRSQRNWRSSNDIGLKLNWLRFLGLKKGRSFWRYILLPSSHKPLFEYYSSYLRHDPTHIV